MSEKTNKPEEGNKETEGTTVEKGTTLRTLSFKWVDGRIYKCRELLGEELGDLAEAAVTTDPDTPQFNAKKYNAMYISKITVEPHIGVVDAYKLPGSLWNKLLSVGRRLNNPSPLPSSDSTGG